MSRSNVIIGTPSDRIFSKMVSFQLGKYLTVVDDCTGEDMCGFGQGVTTYDI